MRMYGKRFLRNDMKTAAGARVETRDGIIIDIDHTNRWCRVKIQGSEEYIVAQFPENTNSAPDWMKPANAVRLCHKGGVRGKVEVIGRGQTIPTGINTKPPNPPVPKDCIIEGCELILPDARRDAFGKDWGIVWIKRGTYRSAGLVKTLAPILCRKSNPLKMLNVPVIGSVAEQFTIKMPQSGLWAYCRFVIDPQTGIIEMLSGSHSAKPELPALSAGKLDLGWVLLQGGKNVIDECDINAYWQRPAATYFLVDGAPYLDWGTKSAAFTITVYDQFARPITGQWSAAISITKGTGFVGRSESDAAARSMAAYSQGAATLTFVYQRNTVGIEISPVIDVAINEMAGSAYETGISLANKDGEYL